MGRGNKYHKDCSKEKLILLHCVSAYPANFEDLNFPKMVKLKNLTDVIGYSGHHQTIDDAILAISMGLNLLKNTSQLITVFLEGTMNLLFYRQNLQIE